MKPSTCPHVLVALFLAMSLFAPRSVPLAQADFTTAISCTTTSV